MVWFQGSAIDNGVTDVDVAEGFVSDSDVDFGNNDGGIVDLLMTIV